MIDWLGVNSTRRTWPSAMFHSPSIIAPPSDMLRKVALWRTPLCTTATRRNSTFALGADRLRPAGFGDQATPGKLAGAGGVHRGKIDMPLHMAAAEQAHKFELVMRLHPFCGGVHVQHLGETGDRGDDRAVAAALLARTAHKSCGRS